MTEKMSNDELLKKWLNGDLTEAEQKAFEVSEDFELNNQILEDVKQFKASNFSKVRSFDEFKAELNEEKETPVIKMTSFKNLSRIAAVLVVSLGLYFAFFSSDITTVTALASQQASLELPDNSSVQLNAGSEVTYDKSDWSDNREVKLKGEAFFKVAKGSKFDVVTSTGTVSVLGTEFTVKQRDGYYEVKCFEGVVSVASNNKTYKLTQGKIFRLINGNESLSQTAKNSPDWLHNISSFESVPLVEAINELERQFNVTVTHSGVDINRIYTGAFMNDNLEQALKSLTIPLELSYKINNKNIIISKK